MTRITAGWLREYKACKEQVPLFAEVFPDGAEVTLSNCLRAHEKGLDAIWALCHLMTPEQRKTFILFTLRQRQPHLVTLLQRAHLNQDADAVASIVDWTSDEATRVLAAAGAAARAAAWPAGAAAWAAAWAARAAAGDAAWAAARDAAWDAARDAAGDAAWDAARDAAMRTQLEEACRILGAPSLAAPLPKPAKVSKRQKAK